MFDKLKIKIAFIGILVMLFSVAILSTAENSKSNKTFSSSEIKTEVSYFLDNKGCEYMLVRNKYDGINQNLVNAYFQIVHLPTCSNNSKHTR